MSAAAPRSRRGSGPSSRRAPLRSHVALLVECLERLPLEAAAHAGIRAYLAFLRTVVVAGEWTNVPLTGDVHAIVRALRAPLAFHRLRAYHIESFDHVGDDGDWRSLAELVELLEPLAAGPRRPMFRVAWGF